MLCNILMIGFGIVNSLEYKKLKQCKNFNIKIYDKYNTDSNSNIEDTDKFDFAFLCVPTNYIDKDNPCDISEVLAALTQWKNRVNIFVIRSTILPELSDKLYEVTPNIIYMLELYGATQHANNYKQNFSILGGEKTLCYKVQQLLQELYDASHSFRITDIKTALLAKYMINSYLAFKVSFCNQFYDLANILNLHYEELRELFILDDRINPSHTYVYNDKPYWDSHCFNKDVPAIAETYDMQLLKDLNNFNNNRKR